MDQDRPGATLRADERLRSSSDYRRAYRLGMRMDGRFFLLLAVQNDQGLDRLGLVVSRRLGGAALRNRAKRLLRETFRRNKLAAGRPLDLVLVAKREIASRKLDDVEREYRSRLGRLAARFGVTCRSGSDPASD